MEEARDEDGTGTRAEVRPPWFAMADLERRLSAGFVARLKERIERGGAHDGAACPSCRQRSARLVVAVERSARGPEVVLDACRACGLVRVDAMEFEKTPRKAPDLSADPAAVRRALAVDSITWESERARELHRWSDDLGELALPSRILMWIGVPVDIDSPEMTKRPLLTWLLACALVATQAVLPSFGSEAWRTLAWIPGDPLRLGGLPIVLCFFVHASWLHLLGNLYFLLVFGRVVENRIGAARMAVLLLLATMAGNVVHASFDPKHSVPLVGASGGLSALITCYAAAYPWNRFGIGLWFLLRPRLFVAPALVWAVLWFVWQFLGALQQSIGLNSISCFAHLGGALTGLVAWWIWRKRT